MHTIRALLPTKNWWFFCHENNTDPCPIQNSTSQKILLKKQSTIFNQVAMIHHPPGKVLAADANTPVTLCKGEKGNKWETKKACFNIIFFWKKQSACVAVACDYHRHCHCHVLGMAIAIVTWCCSLCFNNAALCCSHAIAVVGGCSTHCVMALAAPVHILPWHFLSCHIYKTKIHWNKGFLPLVLSVVQLVYFVYNPSSL